MSPQLKSIVASLVLLAACGKEPTPPEAPVTKQGTSSLETAFTEASAEFQVPVELLKAIAYVETRVSPNTQDSFNGGHGMMNLVERDDWKMVSRASALTGLEAGRLAVDPRANVRGAAAALRELADKSFRSYPVLSANNLGDWFQAVSFYPGIDSASLANDYAADVFLRMEQGFSLEASDGLVVLAPTVAQWRQHSTATSRTDALGDYPGIAQFKQTPNYTSGRTNYTYVVIHTMQGSYAGSISWIMNPASQVSANYCVRSSDGQITQMVSDSDTAWHAQCYNSKSIGVEHEGYVADPGKWYTDAMYTESAKLTRWVADKHGIPKDRSHFIGHAEVSSNCNTNGHTDPGSGWNWTKYMGLVNGSTPTTTTGVLIGAIYSGGNSANRVAGAVVTVAGQTLTTGTDGLYQFTLAPGAYTVNVSKSGFGTNSVARTVVAGSQVWGSMEINAVAAAGILRGKIFSFNAANPTDMSVAIDGAVVTCSGQTVTTGADGMYLFNLAPGNYTVNVSKAGFSSNSVARAVMASATIWGSIGLTGMSGPDQQAPQVAISFPSDNAQLDLAVFNLTGNASDNGGPVAEVSVALNGGAPTVVPVASGAFSIQVKLKPGSNSLKVTARDAAGNVGTAIATATFNAGVAGFIHVAGDEAARVASATVQLREVGTGVVVSSSVTDATGAFALAAATVAVDYVLYVKAAGFVESSQTVTVPDDQRLKTNVGLTVGDELNTAGTINFTDPKEGSTVTTDRITVYGNVTGFDLVKVTVNGALAELPGGGGFIATVPLKEGANTIEAIATGLAGQTTLGTLHVVRKLGGNSKPPPMVGDMVAAGTCSVVGGIPFWALAVVVPMLRRRRRGA